MLRLRNGLVLLITIGSVFGFTTTVFAAMVTPTSLNITNRLPQSMQLNWAIGGGDAGSAWSLQYSTDGLVATRVAPLTPHSTLNYNFTGLTTNTLYYLGVASGDGSTTSTYATSSSYTAADTPGTPSFTGFSPTYLYFTTDFASNPNNTLYIVRDTASSTPLYLMSDGTLTTVTTTLTYTDLFGGGSGFFENLVATNSLHTISIAAVNSDNTATTSYSATTSAYSQAVIPSGTASATSTSATTITLTFSPTTLNSNPTTTNFIVRDQLTYFPSAATYKYLQSNLTWGDSPATLTYAQVGAGGTITTTGLTSNTQHAIQLAAVNGSGTITSYTNTAGEGLPGNIIATPASVPISVGYTPPPVSGGGSGPAIVVTPTVTSTPTSTPITVPTSTPATTTTTPTTNPAPIVNTIVTSQPETVSTVWAPPSLLKGINPRSAIVFTIPKQTIHAGKNFTYTYTFTNTSKNVVYATIWRDVIGPHGVILSHSIGTRTALARHRYTFRTNQLAPKIVGIYTMRITIINQKKPIATNSFYFKSSK